MDFDRPNIIEIAGQIITGLLSVAVLTAIALVLCGGYYQAVGRIDWTVLVR